MGRKLRPYLPGTIFHLTSRTIGHERWFCESVRDTVEEIFASSLRRSDARLLAHTVMPNHYHLVVQQGDAPLSQLMHGVNRRIALMLHRLLGREGHMLERPYRALPCLDPTHARNVIVYTNLNARRAKLCDDVAAYRWGSHFAYMGATSRPGGAVELPLTAAAELFASAGGRSRSELAADYDTYVQYRQACDALPVDAPRPPSPPVSEGDQQWFRHYGHGVPRHEPPTVPRPDLRDIALATIRDLMPGLELEALFGRFGNRAIMATRHEVIRRALESGYRNVQIARFLRVSEPTICRVANSMVNRPPACFSRIWING